MHQLPADIEEKLVDFILANPPEKDSEKNKGWLKGHDRPAVDETKESADWLGSHENMRTPGKITLYRDNLNSAFWRFVSDKEPDQIHHRNLCRSLIYMVLVHERFHHFCDVYGQITQYRGGDRNKAGWWHPEEALATAWEWQELRRSCEAFSRLPMVLRQQWIDWWFDKIKAPGYKDWKDYRHSCLFKEALLCHIVSANTALTDTANAELTEWFFAQLNAPQWCDGAAVYQMATTADSESLSPPEFPPLHDSSCWIEGEESQPLCNKGRGSLSGIQEMESFDGVLCLNGNPIKDTLLGLLLVKGLDRVCLTGLSGDLLKAIEILNKHLPKGRSAIIDCQNELFDAGLDDFAKL